jgi:hypothetical protein
MNVSAIAIVFAGVAVTTMSSAAIGEPREVNVVPPKCYSASVAKVHRADYVPPREEEPVQDRPGEFHRCGACAGSMEYARHHPVIGSGHVTAYRRIVAMEQSRPGDKLTVCLVRKYVNCPKGDDRGRTYVVKNHRTGRTWEGHDASHICGGA